MYNNPKYKYQFYAPNGETQAPAFDPQLPPVIKEETNNNTQKPKKKNLITALKKLLAAFGGEETQSNNAVEIVDKIADSVEQGGGGSDGGIFVVTCEVSIVDEQPVLGLASKGALDIIEAVNAHLLPVLFIHPTQPGLGNVNIDEIMVYFSAGNGPSGLTASFAPIRSANDVSLVIEEDRTVIILTG